VPVWCGADTPGREACRNNSRELLFGCNQFRQHKMQVSKAAVIPRVEDYSRWLRCPGPRRRSTLPTSARPCGTRRNVD
jgi:hypothetical protein